MSSDDWVSLQIVRRAGSPHWVLLSPWDDRVNVPSFANKAENITAIVVVLKGDKEILRSGVALRALTERCNGRVQPKAGQQITDEERQLARKAQAEAVGLTPEELDQAIREWGRRAKDPYERGLVELYEKNYSKAEELLKESQAIRKETFQKAKAELANTTTFLGQSLYLQGKFSEAVVAFREVTVLKGDDLLPLIWLGSGLLAMDENSEAEQVFKRALINSERAFGTDAPVAAPILASLTVLSTLQGKYDEAKKYSEKAGAIVGKFSGQENIFAFLNKIANAELNKSQGRFAEAESFYKDAIAYTEKLNGSGGTFSAPLGHIGLAKLYESQKKYAEAELLYQRAFKIIESVFGNTHIFAANALESLGLVYEEQKRYEEAEAHYQLSLAIEEKALGTEHPTVAITLSNIALFYYEQGKYAEAEPLYKRALEIREKVFGKDHPDTSRTINNLARLYRAQERYVEAETHFMRAIEIREKALGKEHPDTVTSLSGLALLYKAQERYNEAELLYRRILEIREKSPGKEHPDTASTLNNLAELYYAQGEYAEAEPLYKRALGIREKVFGKEPLNVAITLENYAALLRKMNRGDEAAKLEARAREIRAKAK